MANRRASHKSAFTMRIGSDQQVVVGTFGACDKGRWRLRSRGTRLLRSTRRSPRERSSGLAKRLTTAKFDDMTGTLTWLYMSREMS